MNANWLLIALALSGPLAARAAEGDAALRGRALYQGWTPYAAGTAATPLRIAPDLLACARCHGVHGEGGREGGQAVPPLRWSALMQAREGRPAYGSDDAVVRALAQGRGRAGQPLGATMPRFTLTSQETTALVAYLKRLGTEADPAPGVEPQVLHLGSIVPLTGPAAAAGNAIVAGLRAGLEQANAQGGIHGRRIRLHVQDARQGAPAALQRLRAEPLFALVGGLWNESVEPMDAQLAAARVSHIGALVVREQSPRADAWSADLLAPLAEQRRSLAGALEDCAHGPRVALVTGVARAPAPDTAVTVRWVEADAGLDAALAALKTGAAGCIAYTPAHGPAVQRALPSGWVRMLVLPMPAELLAEPQVDGALQPWHRLGWCAARLTVELLSRAGRQLHERDLLAQLGGMGEWPLAPGVALHYGRLRRHGWDASVVPLGVSTIAAAQRLAAHAPQKGD